MTRIRDKILHFFFSISQVLTFFYVVPVGYLLMRVRIIRPKQFIITPGTLIISNHQSKSDPFFIAYHIGWHNIRNNFPLSFPTIHTFMDLPVVGQFLWALHCFRVGPSVMEKTQALIKIRDQLQSKQTVVLFPEGKRIFEGNQVEQFHRSIDILLAEDVPVVLIRLTNFNQWSLYKKDEVQMRFCVVPDTYTVTEKRKFIDAFYQ